MSGICDYWHLDCIKQIFFCGVQSDTLILFNLVRVFIHGLRVYILSLLFQWVNNFPYMDVLSSIGQLYLPWNTISAVVWFVLSIWRHDILTWITLCVPRRTTAAIPQQYKLIWHNICVLFYLRVFISLWKPNDELYVHLHMCSLVYFMHICSLLKYKYLFSNYSLSFFVILLLEFPVCIMMAFNFCKIIDTWISASVRWTSYYFESIA